MTFSLRPRTLNCFYCGSKSAQKQSGSVRRWQCQQCDAVNYLDKNGQITDPPAYSSATATPPAPRFAHAPLRSASPPPSSQDSLFCKDCLKNQHLLTQTLASYLPAPSDPKYAEYERSYPAYLAKLEQRYPQVCAKCLPGVRERIRRAGYVAKTDHLRRMVEQTRLKGTRRPRTLGWRGVVLQIGGLGWATSLALQLIWHVMGTLALTEQDEHLSEDLGSPASLLENCARNAVFKHRVQRLCLEDTAYIVHISLALGFATLWWNSKLRQRYDSVGGRLVGLKDYYAFQVLVLLVRGAAYWLLRDGPLSGSNTTTSRGIQAFMALFLVLCAAVSMNVVKIDRSPQVTFHADLDLPTLPQQSQGGIETVYGTHTRPIDLSSANSTAFPIAALAPTTPFQRPGDSQDQPLTPPLPEDDDRSDVDAMDWTPSNQNTNFQPRTSARLLDSKFIQMPSPSPFRGTLPKAPIPPAHKLRNPVHSSPPFRKASESAQQTFFSSLTRRRARHGPMSSRASTTTSVAGETDYDDNDDDDASVHIENHEIRLAPPKLFLKEDKVETGLEAMFDEVFSIRDEPNGVTGDSSKGRVEQGDARVHVMTQQEDKGLDHEYDDERTSSDWSNVVTAVMIPACILGGVAVWVKGWK